MLPFSYEETHIVSNENCFSHLTSPPLFFALPSDEAGFPSDEAGFRQRLNPKTTSPLCMTEIPFQYHS